MPWYAKKVGPFPVGVYAAVGVGAIGIGLYLRKRNAALTPEGVSEDVIEPGWEGYPAVGAFFPPTFESPPMPGPTIDQPGGLLGAPLAPYVNVPATPPAGSRPVSQSMLTTSLSSLNRSILALRLKGYTQPTGTFQQKLSSINKQLARRLPGYKQPPASYTQAQKIAYMQKQVSAARKARV